MLENNTLINMGERKKKVFPDIWRGTFSGSRGCQLGLFHECVHSKVKWRVRDVTAATSADKGWNVLVILQLFLLFVPVTDQD